MRGPCVVPNFPLLSVSKSAFPEPGDHGFYDPGLKFPARPRLVSRILLEADVEGLEDGLNAKAVKRNDDP